MTVSTTDSVELYVSGGPAFPIPFQFFQNSDIVAVLTKQDGTSETLTTAQYALTGAGSQEGGTLTSAYAAGVLATPGGLLTISREMVAVQPTDLRNQGKFLAETHERVFDRLTMLIQQCFSVLSRALKRPIGKNYFDAEGRRIASVADPVAPQDAATAFWARAQIGAALGEGHGPDNVAQNVAYINGDGAVTNLQNGTLRQFSGVKSLAGKTGSAGGEQAILTGYHLGSKVGGGTLTWAPSILKSQHDGFRVFSPTVPSGALTTSQASIISYMNRTGETDAGGSGCWIRFFDGPAHMEWGGVTAGTDCGLLAQRLVDACVPSGISLHCDEVLTLGSDIYMPQYRTDPAVTRVFNHSRLFLRSVNSTITAGPTFVFEASGADLDIGELNGPGADVGFTKGILMAGQGGGRVRVGWLQGFQNGVEFNGSYAHSLFFGWIDNCIRGIALVGSNDNRIVGGRLGGRYSTVATIGPTDSTTCEIGVNVGADCASNRFTMNIEYCRRSANSIGFNDLGVGTQFSGYIESCTGWNAYLQGRNADFKILPGGSVSRADTSGFYAADTNTITFEAQQDFYNESPSPEKNTLAFEALQALATSGTGRIVGKNGLDTYPRNLSSARNEVLSSNTLGAASWGAFGAGGASVSGIFAASSIALPELGINASTQVTLPALAADDAEYVISQGGITTVAGPMSFGLYALCAAGDVDVYVRVVSSDGTVQQRIVTRLTAVSGGGFKQIMCRLTNTKADANATYQIRLRTAVGCTLYLCGAFVVNRVDVEIPPINPGAERRGIIAGTQIRGKMLPNGVMINGTLQKDYRVVSAAETFDSTNLLLSTIVTTGAGYNITLSTGFDGQELTIKRDGTAGSVGVLLSGTTVDGSAAGITMAPLDVLRLRFVPALGWLKV